ncbi:hypothetical protein NLI96_g7056 [Meripilus lineatus]|uniref:Uncharacterized protein n=1 Tax=Meripilus lineatus TaxID=2056292 RepID=A0AAD5YCE0_9APHY|nr:hypothetical protein NLI96_g7056 [Physisporinus lineatus]
MTYKSFCGIVYKPKEGDIVHLPLDEVRVQAVIVDVSAKVTLSQVFLNPLKAPTFRAKYVFPVPARAAVCAFEMRTEDGRVITGVAKEKEKAAAEHKAAIRQGRMTGLVEWATDDVFTISIGAIPAEQKLTTKLTYTIDLMNDDLTDQIRFQLPMCVGMRYGSLPDTMVDASAPTSSTRVRIVVGIQTKGDIQSVTSPSHPQFLAYPFKEDDGEPSSNRMIASYESPDFLSQDFVVNVQARGLDEPRCFAENDPKHGSVSLQLTMVPKLNLPPIASQEYIFLVDRSGSMTGSRIETAKRTLVMLLRSLPASGTSFNIFSFGSHSSKMFPASSEYTQDSLTSATEHVDAMSADYGGTEIRSALESVFKSRNKHSPTAVFVLTDGEAYDIDSCLRTVTDAVSKSKADSPLRVFVLGIGESTSTAMCEGIARAGNGVCLMATTSENILGKCSKLVRASRTFILKNISIDWGVPTEAPTKSTLGFRQSPPKRDSVVLQSPSKIESIYPGLRFVVTAMIKDKEFKIPEEVVLKGKRDGHGEAIEIKVPVQLVQPTKDDDTIPLVNTLAARRIITELEDPKNESKHSPEQKKATIIRFGEEYQLASRFTSFVAVGDHISEYQKSSSKAKEKSREKEKEKEKEKKGKSHAKGGSLSQFVGNFFGSSGPGESQAPSKEEEASEEASEGDDEDWDLTTVTDSFIDPYGGPVALHSAPRGPPMMAKRRSAPMAMGFGGAPRMQRMVGGGLPTGAPPPPPAPAPMAQLDAAMYASPAPLFSLPSLAAAPSFESSKTATLSSYDPLVEADKELSSAPRGKRVPSSISPPIPTPAPPAPIVPQSTGFAFRTASRSRRGGGGGSGGDGSTETPVVRLVRLQAFNGSFALNDEFTEILGKDAVGKGKAEGVDDTIWATALAVAFFRKHLADQPELLDGLVEKATDFVSGSPLGKGIDFDALVEKAKECIV